MGGEQLCAFATTRQLLQNSATKLRLVHATVPKREETAAAPWEHGAEGAVGKSACAVGGEGSGDNSRQPGDWGPRGELGV